MGGEVVGSPDKVLKLWEAIYGTLPERRVSDFHKRRAVSELTRMPPTVVKQAFRRARQPEDAARIAAHLLRQPRQARRQTNPTAKRSKTSVQRDTRAQAGGTGNNRHAPSGSGLVNQPKVAFGTVSKQGF